MLLIYIDYLLLLTYIKTIEVVSEMNKGYARVSSQDQNLDLQIDALKKAGCDVIYQDTASGARSSRQGLNEALAQIGKGDVLVVWKIDRLGRNVKGLVDLLDILAKRGADFRSITDSIDTQGTTGRFIFHIMGAFAEMERELIRERTRAGLAAAKARGRCGGRPRKMTSSKLESAQKLLKEGMPVRDVSNAINVSLSTVYRWFPASNIDLNDVMEVNEIVNSDNDLRQSNIYDQNNINVITKQTRIRRRLKTNIVGAV